MTLQFILIWNQGKLINSNVKQDKNKRGHFMQPRSVSNVIGVLEM